MYKKHTPGYILRVSDNCLIPADMANTDYVAYLNYVEEGGAIDCQDYDLSCAKSSAAIALDKAHKDAQTITIVHDVSFTIPLIGETLSDFLAIISRASCEDEKGIQEWRFVGDDGVYYHAKLYNFFWLKLFSGLFRYLDANKRIYECIRLKIDNATSCQELDGVDQDIAVFPSGLMLNISEAISNLLASEDVPVYLIDTIKRSAKKIFFEATIEAANKDIWDYFATSYLKPKK